MAGKMNISTNGGDIICRNNSRAIVLDTYYYSNWSADVPADAISTDYYDMVSGKLCYQLNAGRSEENQAWFQTLSEDRFPVPDNRHLPVWLFAGSYVNDSPDGIGTIQNSKFKIQNSEGEAIYNLNGQRVNGQWSNGKWPHGIYIINGRKTLR